MATILIVDDDAAWLEIAGDFVTDKGHRVLRAPTAQEALEHIAKSKPDLVLLDYQMPNLDGTQVFALLRLNPATAELPVIFMSGLSSQHYAGLMEPDRFVRFLGKPCDFNVLAGTIAELLSLKKS